MSSMRDWAGNNGSKKHGFWREVVRDIPLAIFMIAIIYSVLWLASSVSGY